MSFELLSLAAILLAVTIALVRFRDLGRQARVEQAMEDVIEPGARHEAFAEVELVVRENRALLGAYHRDALRLREQGRALDAAAEMAEGCGAIQSLVPGFIAVLNKLRALARPLAAIRPLPPLRVRSMGAHPLCALVAFGLLAHHLLLTGRERVLWHLRVLGVCFRSGVVLLRRATTRLPEREREWRRIDLLVGDLTVIGDQTVDTGRRILLTLDAFDRLHARRSS